MALTVVRYIAFIALLMSAIASTFFHSLVFSLSWFVVILILVGGTFKSTNTDEIIIVDTLTSWGSLGVLYYLSGWVSHEVPPPAYKGAPYENSPFGWALFTMWVICFIVSISFASQDDPETQTPTPKKVSKEAS